MHRNLYGHPRLECSLLHQVQLEDSDAPGKDKLLVLRQQIISCVIYQG